MGPNIVSQNEPAACQIFRSWVCPIERYNDPPPLSPPDPLGGGNPARANMNAATNMNSKTANYWVRPRE